MSRHHKKQAKKKNVPKPSASNEPQTKQITKNESKVTQMQTLRTESAFTHQQKVESMEVFKFKKSRVPHHLVIHSEIIEDHRLGIKDQVKKIKKIFFDICPQIQQFSVQLRRANYYPTIIVQFQTCALRTKQYVFLRDIMKDAKDIFKQNKQKIHCTYSCLFDIIPSKFIRIAVFGILKAKELKVKLSYKMNKQKQGNDLSLYYTWDRSKRDLNFALIDKNLTIIDFSGRNIYAYHDHQQQIHLYESFLQYLTHNVPSVLELEQMQEKYPIFNQIIQQSSTQLIQKINQYLQKDLRIYDEQCLQKQQQILNLWADNNTDGDIDFIQKLNDEITHTIISVQNYAEIVMETEQKVKRGKGVSNYEWVGCLKRLMMGEKQIESKLPILNKKQQIFKMLDRQNIILIEGETGSGKSTQIPQILCQYYRLFQRPQSKPVLISQPRRLATRTLAQRVASQLGESLGRFVDFKNTLDRQVSKEAKIVFKLDRLVLDELTEDRLLSAYSCLVIDEAHERTISIDVIAGLIKDLVKARPDFKVIITSASMDVELFENYFSNTKALRVSGRLYEVNVQYRQTEGDSSLEKIKRVLNEQVIEQNNSLRDPFSGHVLVFCHSVDEITQLTEYYSSYLNPNRFQVYPLHGKIYPEEQRKAFNATKRHKLIFASRIAQTAITIDDVRVVVDPGEDYEMVYNQRLKYTSMKLRQISQSSAKQRAGRAGRTAPGFCFRLYSEESFRARPLGKIPEMENSSLDSVVLRLKSLGIENLFTFSYISPPDRQGIQTSIQTLKIVEAIDQNSEITAIGQILLLIPIQPILGRSLIQAVFIEQVLGRQNFISSHMKDFSGQQRSKITKGSIRKSIVQILSMIINSSSLFYISQNSKNQSNLNKFNNFPLKEGDFFLLRSLYEEYKHIYETLGDRSELKFWLNYFFLNKKGLKQVREIELQMNKLVIDCIQLDFSQLQNELDQVKFKLRYCKSYNDILLLSLVTSFVPNICRYSGNPEIGYTLISQRRPIQIYGSSAISIVGLTVDSASWILAYDLYTSQKGRFYCKIAQQIDIDFLEKIIGDYAWVKFGMKDAKFSNPYYQKIVEETLPSRIYAYIHNQYVRRQKDKSLQVKIFDKCTFLFDDDSSKITIFVLKEILQSNSSILDEYYSYKNKIEKRYKQNLNHAYLGTTKVQFNSQFMVVNVQKIIQSDIIISQITSTQQQVLRNYLKQYSGINTYSRVNWMRIQIQDQNIRRSFQTDFESFIKTQLKASKLQVKRVPRNQRKISQSKVLIVFKVENLLYRAAEKNIQKYYNMLRQIINGEKQQGLMKRPQQWRQDIQNMLVRVNISPQQCAINIWKNDIGSRKRAPFVQICAQITNIQGGIYTKLVQLQDTNEYLGCQSFYIRQIFEQIIAFPSQKVFSSLKQEYIQILISIRQKYKGFNAVDKYLRLGNKFRVSIICKSWAREQLWEASQRIGGLFSPKLIYLTENQLYFLQNVDKCSIIQKLQNEYKYTIALQIDRQKLYVYCGQEIYEQIVEKLKIGLSTSEYITKQISYRNKSLQDMVTLIDDRQHYLSNNTISPTKIQYKIRFDKKIIFLTANERQHDILQTEFQRINDIEKHECIICNSKVSKSYRLLNCSHRACKNCLQGHLNQTISPQNHAIACPYPDCSHPISIYDIQSVLGQNQFEKWSDQRTIRYVQTQLKKEICSRCQLLLWDYHPQQQWHCNFCGFIKKQ